AALATVPKPRMTAATGLYNVVRQVCGSVGIALTATELTRGTARYHDILAEHVTAYNNVAVDFLARAQAAMLARSADAHIAAQKALSLVNLMVRKQAAVLAYNRIFALIAMMFLLAIPLAFLLANRGIQPAEAPAAPPQPGRGAEPEASGEAEPSTPATMAPETSPEEELVPTT
ncbi:MAG TPA: hypothetical protein VF832_02420, partial [Longimicrobiales bacterium]